MRRNKRVKGYRSKPKMTIREHLTKDGKTETKTRQFIVRQLINSKGNICAICGLPIENKKDLTLDHIKPISKGGLTTIENCQLAHKWCNLRKGNKYAEKKSENR